MYSHSALATTPSSKPPSRGGESPAPLQLQLSGVPNAARGALPHLSFDVSSLRRLFPSLSHEDVACEVARARDRSKLGGPRGNQAAMVSQTLKALADQVERQRRFDREQGTMSYQVALVAATPRLEPHQSPWLLPLNGPHSRQAGQPVPPPAYSYSSGSQSHRPSHSSMHHPFTDAYSPRGSMMINQPPSTSRTPRGSVFQHQAHESLAGSPAGSPRGAATRGRASSFAEVENHFPLPISPQTKHRQAQARHGQHGAHDSKEEHEDGGSGSGSGSGSGIHSPQSIPSRRMSKMPIRAPPGGTGSGPSSQRSSRKHLLEGAGSPADATSPRGSTGRLKRASPVKGGGATPGGVRSGGASAVASQASLVDGQQSPQATEEDPQPEPYPQFRALEADMLGQFSEAHRKHELRLSALASEFKARVGEGAQSAGLDEQAVLALVDEQLAEVRAQAALQIEEVEQELQEIAAQLYTEAEARQENAAPADAAEQGQKEDETIGFLLQARLSAAQERLALLHAAEAERFQAAMTDAVRAAQPTNPAVLDSAQSSYHEHLTATLARDLAALQSSLQGSAASGSGGMMGVIPKASGALDETVKVQKTALIEEALGLKEHVGPEFMRALDDACRLPVARFRALIASQSQLACSIVLRARSEFRSERTSHEAALQPCAVKLDGNIEACPLTFLPRGYTQRLETFTADAARLIASSLAEAQQEVTDALAAIRAAASARRAEEQSAARLIQKNFRKHRERGMHPEPQRSLSSSRSRGSRPQRTGGARPNHAPNPALVAAALTIQRTFRGYWARRIVQRMKLTMVKPAGGKKGEIIAPATVAVAVPAAQKADAETQMSPVVATRTVSSVAVGSDGPHLAAGPPSLLGFDDDEPRSERVAFLSPAHRGAPREDGYGRASSNFLSPTSAYETPGRGFFRRGSTPRSGARGPLSAMNLEDSPRYASAEFDPTSPLPPLSHRPSASGSPSNFGSHDEAHAALMQFLMSPAGVVLEEGATRKMTVAQSKQLLAACSSSDQPETAQLLYVCLQYLRQMRVMCLAVHPSISSLAAMLATFRQADVSIEQALQSYISSSWLLPNSAVLSSATMSHVRCLFPKAIVAFRAVKAVHIEERKRQGAHSLGTPLFESEAHLYHALEKYREKSLSKLSQALYEYSRSTPTPLSAPPSSTRIEGLWLAGHGCTRCIINHYLPTIDGAKQAHAVRGNSASSTRFSVHDAAARTHMMRLVQQRTRVAISGALTRMRILPPPASVLHFSLGHILPVGVSNHELQSWEMCESPAEEMHAHAPLLNDEQIRAGLASSPCGSPLLIEQLLYWDTQLRAHAAKSAETTPRSPSSPSPIPADIVSLLFRMRVRPSLTSPSVKHPKSREARALFPSEQALLKAVSAEMKTLRESAADPDWSESEEQKENECIVASGFEPAPPVAPSRAVSALGRIASTPRAPTPLTALRMPSSAAPSPAAAAGSSSAVASSASAAPVLTGAEFAALPTLTREEQEAIDVQRRADEMVAERAAARAAHAAAEKEAKAAAAAALTLRQKIAAEREAAAIKIQSLQRGRAVRQEASVRRAIRERQQQDLEEEEERKKDRRRTRRRTKAPSSAAVATAAPVPAIAQLAEVAPPDSEVMEVVEVVGGGAAEAEAAPADAQ